MLITSFDLRRVMSYLEPYLWANVLASEWKSADYKTYPYVVNEVEARMLGLELWRRFGFDPEPKWGVCKVVYLHETAVIKIPIHETYAAVSDLETADINTRWPDPKQKVYFPYTVAVGEGVAVQERCRLMTNDEYDCNLAEITMLALELGLFDYHEDNVGFDLYGERFKFFDVQQSAHLRMIGDIESTAVRYKSQHVATDFSYNPLDKMMFKV